MPITVSKMAQNTASVTISVGEDSATILYYPNKVTDKAIAQLDESLDSFSTTLASLIKSWDVLNDDGSMFPPTRIGELGLPFCLAISKAIMADIRPQSTAPQA